MQSEAIFILQAGKCWYFKIWKRWVRLEPLFRHIINGTGIDVIEARLWVMLAELIGHSFPDFWSWI